LWYTRSANGVFDLIQICMKTETDSYEFLTFAAF
jgi:hypothetical protein